MPSHTPSPLNHDTHGARSAASEGDKRPKRLLDLPVEILNAIVKELNHTNDLTSLALCHSALHALTVPHIYSRFDIVWPETSGPEPRNGVDALTYGLSTLVMAGNISRRHRKHPCKQQKRLVTDYAQFTRKFSLGNGPTDWILEYRQDKEGGKMLGTLVALAIARMKNLESFVWDMPTGILSAVWDALSSLDDCDNHSQCRLERVAVRWHNNLVEPRNIPTLVPRRQSDVPLPLSALQHVENPSFSILPPLKALSVLDIDEVQYLDEMSVLLQRSLTKLRELRVGIASHAKHREFVTVWDGDNVEQIDTISPEMSCITLGEKRLGGVLGALTGLFFDLRSARPQKPRPNRLRRRPNATIGTSQVSDVNDGATDGAIVDVIPTESTSSDAVPETVINADSEDDVDNASILSVEHVQATPKSSTADSTVPASLDTPQITSDNPVVSLPHRPQPSSSNSAAQSVFKESEHSPESSTKLSLEVLELEQVPLSIPVLQNVIDWSALTTLTLLRCPNHEHLWKTLRRLYSNNSSVKQKYVSDTSRLSTKPSHNSKTFSLALKHIHTDTVSSSLISFIKDTLQPNSLESVFFLHAPTYTSTVSLDSIYNGVLRRHRSSLKKILIDSGERGAELVPEANTYWCQWMFNREMVKFLGKMPCLRELGVALNYRDWHFFLQNLPLMPQLRSLYIPFLVNCSQSSLADTRELALQIVDIVALRPELELCYVGMVKKCFEILEETPGRGEKDRNTSTVDEDSGSEDAAHDDEGSDDEEQDDDDSDDTDSDTTDTYQDSESDISEHGKAVPILRLREILYYDDKVSVFKARHGRL